MVVYTIPWPPSTNSLWRAFRGRNILSKEARIWFASGLESLTAQKARPILGRVEIVVVLHPPSKRQYDIDNRLKAVLDLLVKAGVIEDDGNRVLKKITVMEGNGSPGATVSISKHEEERDSEPCAGKPRNLRHKAGNSR